MTRLSKTQRLVRFNKAARVVSPVLVPLCEMFAELDSVFQEDGALHTEHSQKSLGRLYRTWKVTRAALDPDFDPNNFERKPRLARENPLSPLALGCSLKSSSDRSSTSEKRTPKTERSERTRPVRSVKAVKSRLNASGVPSKTKRVSGSGVASRTKRGTSSESS